VEKDFKSSHSRLGQKAKHDAAAKQLDELKEAAPDRWEKIKESVGNAFDDLKKIFN
jgi:hypothetical protein